MIRVHWKKTFDAHSEAREKANIKSIYVGNELENNNKVHIVMETPSDFNSPYLI